MSFIRILVNLYLHLFYLIYTYLKEHRDTFTITTYSVDISWVEFWCFLEKRQSWMRINYVLCKKKRKIKRPHQSCILVKNLQLHFIKSAYLMNEKWYIININGYLFSYILQKLSFRLKLSVIREIHNPILFLAQSTSPTKI